MSSPLVCIYCGNDIAEKRLLFERLRKKQDKSAVFEFLSKNEEERELLDALQLPLPCCRASLLGDFIPIPLLPDE